MKVRSLALVAIVALAACSGGAGGGSSPLPGGGGGVVPTATPAPPAPGPTGATASITIRIPLAAHPGSSGAHPAYVSPSTSTLRVQINTVNGATPPAWVPVDVSTPLVVGTNCSVSGGTETCTVPVAAPVGLVDYTFTAQDSGGIPLSEAVVSKTIVQGSDNSFNVTLKGVAASVNTTGATLVANAPPSGNVETLTVQAFDTDGNLIVAPGNYFTPVTLTDNDPTGVTALAVNAGTPASSVVINSPNDVVTLVYNGQALNAFGFSDSVAGTESGGISTTVNDITLSGTTLDDAAHGGLNGDPNWGQQTVFFAQASGTQIFSGAELGWTNAPYNKQFDVTLSAGCAGIATISAAPATSFTVTAHGVGICSGQITEHGTGYPITGRPSPSPGSPTQDGHFWISVTSSSFGVNHSRVTKF